jgi:hypothetical protein
MPRFYFHLVEEAIVQDNEGADLPDEAAARQRALASARDVVAEDARNGLLNLLPRIDVTDEEGNLVFSLGFHEAFTIIGAPAQRPVE